MFSTQTAIASLSSNRSKRDEETARDRWREQVYSDLNAVQQDVDACRLSPADGVAKAKAIRAAYMTACDSFKNKAVAQSCRNYETQDYPGGAQQGAFITRTNRIAAGGANCGKAATPAPVQQATPTPTPTALVPYSPGGSGIDPGCCQMVSGSNLGVTLDGGNISVGISGGSLPGLVAQPAPQTVIGRIETALNNAIHGGDSIIGNNALALDANTGGPIGSSAQVIPFPMKDPFKPVQDTRVPVSGYDAWPLPRDVHMPGGITAATFNDHNAKVKVVNGAQSFGDGEPIYDIGNVGNVSVTASPDPIAVSAPRTGPTNLQSILGAITSALPATISAIKGQPYYNPNQAQGSIFGQQQLGPGVVGTGGAVSSAGATAGAAVGGLGDAAGQIVAQHPYLVIAAGLAAVLLFMKPPSRR